MLMDLLYIHMLGIMLKNDEFKDLNIKFKIIKKKQKKNCHLKFLTSHGTNRDKSEVKKKRLQLISFNKVLLFMTMIKKKDGKGIRARENT